VYRAYLNAPDKMDKDKADAIIKQYGEKDIYALTGSTISSRSVMMVSRTWSSVSPTDPGLNDVNATKNTSFDLI
jgi:hypothetical protein